MTMMETMDVDRWRGPVPTLLDLPDELILAIIGHMRPTAKGLIRTGSACGRLFRLCHDESLWGPVLVDAVGAAAAREAAQRSTCRAIMLWLLSTDVRVTIHSVSASVATASRFVDGCVAMRYTDGDRRERSYTDAPTGILCMENPNKLAMRLLGLAMSSPLKVHVWLVEPCGPHSYRPLRFVHPLPGGWRLYGVPWWLTFYDDNNGDGCGDHIDGADGRPGKRTIALDFLTVWALEDFRATLPPCVVARMDATAPSLFDRRVASAPTWYDGSSSDLGHLSRCDCRDRA